MLAAADQPKPTSVISSGGAVEGAVLARECTPVLGLVDAARDAERDDVTRFTAFESLGVELLLSGSCGPTSSSSLLLFPLLRVYWTRKMRADLRGFPRPSDHEATKTPGSIE